MASGREAARDVVGRGRKGVFSARPAKAPLNLGTGGWEPAAAPGHLRSQQRRVRDRGPAGGSSLKPHVAWATPASPGPSREMGRSRAERTGTGDYGDPAERSALGTGLPTVPVRMGHRNHRASETLGRPGRQQEGPSERSARRHSAARGGASARCASCCVLLPCVELCVHGPGRLHWPPRAAGTLLRLLVWAHLWKPQGPAWSRCLSRPRAQGGAPQKKVGGGRGA